MKRYTIGAYTRNGRELGSTRPTLEEAREQMKFMQSNPQVDSIEIYEWSRGEAKRVDGWARLDA